MKCRGLWAAALLGLTATAVQADVINGSFEAPVVMGSYVTIPAGNSGLTGWTIEKGSLNTLGGSVDQVGSYWQAADGKQSIDLDGSPGTSDESAKISQTIDTVPGQAYELRFFLAGNPDQNPLKTVNVSAGAETETFTFDATGKSHTDMGWTLKVLPFVASSGSTTIAFDSSVQGWYGPALDAVSVAAVPLPAAAWASFGMLGLLGVARVRKGWR